MTAPPPVNCGLTFAGVHCACAADDRASHSRGARRAVSTLVIFFRRVWVERGARLRVPSGLEAVAEWAQAVGVPARPHQSHVKVLALPAARGRMSGVHQKYSSTTTMPFDPA